MRRVLYAETFDVALVEVYHLLDAEIRAEVVLVVEHLESLKPLADVQMRKISNHHFPTLRCETKAPCDACKEKSGEIHQTTLIAHRPEWLIIQVSGRFIIRGGKSSNEVNGNQNNDWLPVWAERRSAVRGNLHRQFTAPLQAIYFQSSFACGILELVITRSTFMVVIVLSVPECSSPVRRLKRGGRKKCQ